MRVCYFGGYDQQHVRARVLLAGLRARGVEIIECHSRHPLPIVRVLSLIQQYTRARRSTDIIVVGAAGHAYVPLAWVLARLTRKPLIFDAFVSVFENWQERTHRQRPRGAAGWSAWALDALSMSLADRVLLDTEDHVEYVRRALDLPSTKMKSIPVGSDLEGAMSLTPHGAAPCRVVFVGSFLPLHGAEVIVQAAALLHDQQDLAFELVGNGETRPLAERACQNRRVAFRDPISAHDYAALLQQADIALGAFGTTPKATRVIPCKVYDALAVGVPLITADTPAVRRLLRDGQHALLVPPGDARALAEAIMRLKRDPALGARLAAAGRRTFTEVGRPAVIGEALAAICAEVLNATKAS